MYPIQIISLLLALFSFQTLTWAQTTKAEKVHSIVKIQYEYDWYKEQATLWEANLKANTNNPEGWQNLYTAARMAKILSPDEDTRKTWLDRMANIIERMKKAIPNTYEYYYIQAYDETDKGSGLEFAKQAYALDPSRPDIYDDFATYYAVRGKTAELKDICKKWKASGDVSPTLLLWNYNMLASTAPNSILITFGDNDTYPAWIVQQADDFRKDVTVLNSSLLLLKDYRELNFKALGIPQLAEKDAVSMEAVAAHVVKHKGEHTLYFAVTGPYYRWEGTIKDKLFNVGMAMRYSDEGNDCTSLLIKNFEQNLLLDHLLYQPFQEEFQGAVIRYNRAYIPGLMMLHEHYVLVGDRRKTAYIKQVVKQILDDDLEYSKIYKVLEQQESNNGKIE